MLLCIHDRTTDAYTVTPPETPPAYEEGTYRHIVGVEHGSKAVWLPGADRAAATKHDADVPEGMAGNTLDYFDKHYVQNPDLYRNCRIGAADMTGAGYLDWIDALDIANTIMIKGVELEGDLPVGAHGVMGTFIEDDPIADHSVVGLAPGLGIQTDGENGAFSLVSHSHNLAHYQNGATNLPDVKMYHQKQ